MASLPTITLEEHYKSPAISSQADQQDLWQHFPADISAKLDDLSPSGVRVQHMDAGHVSVQVVSHAPGAASSPPSLCTAANDELAAACARLPARLAGFACLPMAHPGEAARELARCVRQLGFVGALVDNHLADGAYYDDERFWPVFEAAQQLDVPVYIHPTFPTPEMERLLYRGNYGDKTTGILGSAGWGWHVDCGLHILRLYAAGLFDRFPRLKIIIGHMGEMLPFQLERCDKFAGRFDKRATPAKTLKQVWDENLWVTTSGMFSLNPLACMLRNTRVERILYSVDWPFADNETGWKFLEELRDSGMVSEEQLHMIAYKNAEVLLKVRAVS